MNMKLDDVIVVKSVVFVIFSLHAKTQVVVSLELTYSLQSLSFYELSNGSAVGQLEKVCLEVIVGKTEIEELLWVFLHFL